MAAAAARSRHLPLIVAAIVVALLLLGAGIAYLVASDDDPSPQAAPSPTSTSTSSSTSEPAVTTTTALDGSPAPSGGPTDPVDPADPTAGLDLPVVDAAARAAALQAIAAGPARATDYATPAIDETLIQFGQAICLSMTQLDGVASDPATLPAQLVAARDQLAESSGAIWADPNQASEAYTRVIYYDTKYLCPENLPYADAAFPALAGS